MSFSLKNLPELHPRSSLPKISWWLTALVVMSIVNVILMGIFERYVDNVHFWLFAIGVPAIAWIVSFCLRMLVWSLQDIKANSFDRQREQWILSQTRIARRALQILNTTFITAHSEMQQDITASAMLKNQSIIISQSDWKGENGKRMSRFRIDPKDTPELLASRLLSELIDNLPADQFPKNASLAIVLDISSLLPSTIVREIWQEAWKNSGINCPIEYLDGSGPEVINHWLDHRIKDEAMLLIVGLQIAPVISDNTAEVAIALLLGNRLTQKTLKPVALLHRPDSASPGELNAGMNMAAYNVPIQENMVRNLWLAGLTGKQRAEVIQYQNIHPAQPVEDEAVISLDISMGYAGPAASWLAIAAATEIARQTQSPQMIICGDATQNLLWSMIVIPTASRQEMDQ